MKAVLKFNRNDIDEEMELHRAIKATDMAGVIWEISRNMKKSCEWHIESTPDITAYDITDYIFERITDVIDEHGILIDELYR